MGVGGGGVGGKETDSQSESERLSKRLTIRQRKREQVLYRYKMTQKKRGKRGQAEMMCSTINSVSPVF